MIKQERINQLNELVVMTLESNHNPTARDLFMFVKEESPDLTRRGFRSFVRVISSFNNIERDVLKGNIKVYRIK